jgi:hypothetical protein
LVLWQGSVQSSGGSVGQIATIWSRARIPARQAGVPSIGIELLEHSLDGAPDQLSLIHGLDVVLANQAQHVAEEAQVLVTRGGQAARSGGGDHQQGGCE